MPPMYRYNQVTTDYNQAHTGITSGAQSSAVYDNTDPDPDLNIKAVRTYSRGAFKRATNKSQGIWPGA